MAPYEATRGGKAPLDWTPQTRKAFDEIKADLPMHPLALSDVTKPFHLYVDKKKGVANWILIQVVGPWKKSMAYLSKRLDPVAFG